MSGEFFLKRYKEMDSAVEIPEIELKQGLRVNRSKILPELLLQRLKKKGATLTKIPFLQNGYYAEAEFSLGSTLEYLQGCYYLQAPLSQLTCEVLNPKKGASVLDMAAAPGGKTTYLAELVGEKGKVVAVDLEAGRLLTVRNNVERLGLTNVVCVRKDARFVHDLGEEFDFVLLDAPCSGNYCSEPDWFNTRTLDDIKKNARLQKELLKSAIKCVKKGGRLLYSTCSLEREEDEEIIDWAIKKFDVKVVPIKLDIGSPGDTKGLDTSLSGTRRFWPYKTGCEGFFMALLEKK